MDVPPAKPLGLIAVLRSFPRQLWFLYFGGFLNRFGGFVMPFLALYLTKNGFTVAQAGYAIGAYGIGHVMASLIGGHLADTIGRRETIVVSMGSVGVIMMLLSQAHSFPAIMILVLLAGFTGELYRPAASALLADLTPPAHRVIAYSVYRIAFNAGWAFGAAAGGFLAKKSFFWLFSGDALTSVLFGIIAWSALPGGKPSSPGQVKWSGALTIIRRDKRFLRVLFSCFCIAIVFFQMTSSYGLYVTSLGFTAATYGIVLSYNGLLIVFFELPISVRLSRLPARPILAIGVLLTAGSFAMNGLVHTVPGLFLCNTFLTLGEIFTIPIAVGYVSNLAPVDMRGRYNGVFGLNFAVALVFAPTLGLAAFAWNPMSLWIGALVLGVAACAIILWPTGADDAFRENPFPVEKR